MASTEADSAGAAAGVASAVAGGSAGLGDGDVSATPDALPPLTIQFAGTSLGISIDDELVVVRVTGAPDTLGPEGVCVGHRLLRIGDASTVGMGRGEAVTTLQAAGRPVTLQFGASSAVAAPASTEASRSAAAPPTAPVQGSGSASSAPTLPEGGGSKPAPTSTARPSFGFGKLLTGSKSLLKSLDQSARSVVASTRQRLSVVGVTARGDSDQARQALEDSTVGGGLLSVCNADVERIRRNNRTLIRRASEATSMVQAACGNAEAARSEYEGGGQALAELLPSLQQAVADVGAQARGACDVLLRLERRVCELELIKQQRDQREWEADQNRRLSSHRAALANDVKLASAALQRSRTEVEAQRRKSVAAAARSSVRSKERARAREKDRVKQSLVNRARRATLGALNKVKATAAAAAVTPSNADDGGRAGDTAGAPAPSAPSPAATATSDNGELQAGDDAQVQARAAKRRASQDAAASAAAGAGDAATAGDSGGGASDDSVGSGGGGVLAELEAAGDDVTGGATAAAGGAGVSGAAGAAATMDDADQEIAELESYLDSLADSGDDNA